MNNPFAVRYVSQPFTVEKVRAGERIAPSPGTVQLVFTFIAITAFWLIYGILVGKFIWTETNSMPWLIALYIRMYSSGGNNALNVTLG